MFCAIELARRLPGIRVCVYESGKRPLVKLGMTGGGRCNLSNSFDGNEELHRLYPRGTQIMKRALGVFSNRDAMLWFERAGVKLYIQKDGRVFPKSNDAAEVVQTLEKLAARYGVEVLCGNKLVAVVPNGEERASAAECVQENVCGGVSVGGNGTAGFTLRFENGSEARADLVIVTTGGCSEAKLRAMLPEQIAISRTAPSLYSFKIADEGLRSLMGISVENVSLLLPGTQFRSEGPILITDWGISGPAVLRLSSYAARQLADASWRTRLAINWIECNEEQARNMLGGIFSKGSGKSIANLHPEALPGRLWRHLIQRAGINGNTRPPESGRKQINRLVSVLTADEYEMCGRTAFKEEFVTCGGVDAAGLNLSTLESKKIPGLYFAGEVLDVDAVTGGFNLQAAWSTAMVVAKAIIAEQSR